VSIQENSLNQAKEGEFKVTYKSTRGSSTAGEEITNPAEWLEAVFVDGFDEL
jgi:hypothetical protein